MKRLMLASAGIIALLSLSAATAAAVVASPGQTAMLQRPMAESPTATPTTTVTETASPDPTVTSTSSTTIMKEKTILGVPSTIAYIVIGLLILIAIVGIIGAARSGGGSTSSSSTS